MKKSLLMAVLLCLGTASALAQTHTDKERAEDVARHRAMAAAHERAASCLEARTDDKVCLAQLQVACKGLAIGKYCGMRHVH